MPSLMIDGFGLRWYSNGTNLSDKGILKYFNVDPATTCALPGIHPPILFIQNSI